MEILAEAVRFFAGGRQILQGIDLELRPKEFLGIIGPNGSGKSTFLKCVYRVQKPTTGKIYFNGKKLDEFSYRESALKLAVVAQHNFYNFDFSVLDVVLMGRSPHKKMMERDNAEDYKIARDALRVVGLEEFGERNFSTLSGGEQQMIAIARAMMARPQLMLLDEPSMGLAPLVVQQIFDVIKDINKMGTTVLLVEQNARKALQIADYAYVMETGKIVMEGPAAEVAGNPDVMAAYLGGKKK